MQQKKSHKEKQEKKTNKQTKQNEKNIFWQEFNIVQLVRR